MDEPERLRGRRATLHARAAVRSAVRAWFEGEGFLEVETPLRVPSPGQEIHLDAIPAGPGRYLITSPEYHMKRLVGGGFSRVFQLGRSFRAGETGPHHQPEFTMLEWYREGAPLEALADDCEAILEVAARAARHPGFAPPLARTTVRDLVSRHAHYELQGDETPDELRVAAAAAGVEVPEGTPWDDVFFQLFLDRVEPHLAAGPPTFVFDWPVPLGALARRRADDPRLVERFELYAGGLELVNAFGELVDPEEQRTRFLGETEIRRKRGKAVYPVDEKLLAALGRMPATSGAALGFDRLVMLVTGARDIREVMAFADDEV
jgi:lysyl-tRNA synthetase class 2